MPSLSGPSNHHQHHLPQTSSTQPGSGSRSQHCTPHPQPQAISPTSAEDVLKVLQSNQTSYVSSTSRSFSGAADEQRQQRCQRKDSGIVHTMTDERRRSVLREAASNSIFELSDEYTQGHDRLDKHQLAENEESLARQRRRNSVSGGNAPTTTPRQPMERRDSLCAITTVHGEESLRAGKLPDGTDEAAAADGHHAQQLELIKTFVESKEGAGSQSASATVGGGDGEEEILSATEEENMLRMMRAQQSSRLGRRRSSGVGHLSRQTPVMEELMEEVAEDSEENANDEIRLEVPTSRAAAASSELVKDSRSSAANQPSMGRGRKTGVCALDPLAQESLQPGSSKGRSRSLYPSMGNHAFSGLVRLRNAVLPPKPALGPQDQQAANPPQRFADGRSDSIDSGFSCASSGSSYDSSSDDEEGRPRNAARRGRSASVYRVGGASTPHAPPSPFEPDHATWSLKSLKRLVEVTKQLNTTNHLGVAGAMSEAESAFSECSSVVVFEEERNTGRKVSLTVDNVKKFIRHNDWPVSHEIRADLWRVLCHNKDFDSNKRLYGEQLEELTKSGVKTLRPSFLAMDGIVVHDHGLKESGAVCLQRLLIVIECVRPEIRYVPILYPLCAMFLHYMTAEETFACVMRLLSQGNTFVLQSELAHYASFHTLLSLLKKYKKGAYGLLRRRVGTGADDTRLAEVFSEWAAWIFKHMPFEYLVRVMDCFLVEGHKMLLRVVLSLVYIWCKERPRGVGHSVGIGGVKSGNLAVLRSSTMPSQRPHSGQQHASNSNAKQPFLLATQQGSDGDKTVEQRLVEVQEQISAIAANCPISVQTLLDMGCSIRNFKHSTFEHRQKHYEDKFRDEVARRRADRVHAQVRPHRSIYTAAFESKIVDTEAASELISALPSRFQLETPQLIFRLSEHGASFVQLWNQVDEAEQSLLIIRATDGAVFGAYCSSCWAERRDVRERTKAKYFGTGESFVWKLHAEMGLPVVYHWAGKMSDTPDTCAQMFMTAGDRFLIIGSGGGDSIAIRDELTKGLSYPCETFASPSLVESTAFEIDELEVFNVIGSRAKA